MNNEILYKQIILDHYNNPKNKVLEVPKGYKIKKGLNPSCGDELEMYLKMDNDVVEDVKFNGEGCSICCASASVLTQEIKGCTKDDVQIKIKNFTQLLKGEEFDQNIFEDAIAYSGISKFPARFKCAFLGWKTINDILNEEE